MAWITPIINRTQADVDLVIEYGNIGYNNLTPEQKAVWDAGMIGALNAKDLNRIELNIQYLANLLEVGNLLIKSNWKMSDICRSSDFNRILSNLDAVKNKFNIDFEYEIPLPATPDLPLNSFDKINDIENILYIIHENLIQVYSWSNFITSETQEFITSDGEKFRVVNQ